MNGHKTIIGICALCALILSAIGAQSASAAGTTAYTCKAKSPAGGAGFSASHCKPADAVASGATFEHKSFEAGTVTEIEGTDLNTASEHTGAIFKFSIAGGTLELVANAVSGSGTMRNSEEGGEMIAAGEGKLLYSGVTEKLLGCKVTGKPGGAGAVETKQLSATTEGVGDKVRVTPKEGTIFAEFELTGCVFGPTTVKVVGSVLAVPNGATLNTVHNTVTAEGTLRLSSAFGPVAGIEGSVTIGGRSGGSGAFTPLSVTT